MSIRSGDDAITVTAENTRSRPVTLVAALSAAVMLLSGCALVAKEAVKVVLQIAEDVLVQTGEDYLQKIFSPKDANGDSTVVISVTNGDGDGVGSTYAVNGFSKLTTANVTVRSHQGGVHIVADGNGIAVTVDVGANATIEINTSGNNGHADSFAGAGDEAATINSILQWSSRSRSALSGALAELAACRHIDEATSSLQHIAGDRGRQADALADIDVSHLPSGDSLRNSLVEALAYSRNADLSFVRWGQAERSGCRQGRNYRSDAMNYSRQADVAKDEFTGEWNRIASRYGLPRYHGTEI